MSLFAGLGTVQFYLRYCAVSHQNITFLLNNHLHGNVSEFYVNLLGGSAFSSETSLNFCKTTRRCILEHTILYMITISCTFSTMSNPTGSSLFRNGWLHSTKWPQLLNTLSSTHEIVLHVRTVHTVVIWHFRHWNCSGVLRNQQKIQKLETQVFLYGIRRIYSIILLLL